MYENIAAIKMPNHDQVSVMTITYWY